MSQEEFFKYEPPVLSVPEKQIKIAQGADSCANEVSVTDSNPDVCDVGDETW